MGPRLDRLLSERRNAIDLGLDGGFDGVCKRHRTSWSLVWGGEWRMFNLAAVSTSGGYLAVEGARDVIANDVISGI